MKSTRDHVSSLGNSSSLSVDIVVIEEIVPKILIDGDNAYNISVKPHRWYSIWASGMEEKERLHFVYVLLTYISKIISAALLCSVLVSPYRRRACQHTMCPQCDSHHTYTTDVTPTSYLCSNQSVT